jgi:hypothetical protein
MSDNEIYQMLEEKLPIKYILGIEREFEAFPDAFDIVYIYINRAIKQPDRWGDAFTKHSLIKYEAAEASIEAIEAGLKRAIELGLIECTNETEGKESYRIILNPFA